MAVDTTDRSDGTARSAAVAWHRQTLAFTRRSLQQLLHDRSALFWALVMPVFFYLLIGVAGTDTSGDAVGQQLAAMAVSFGIFGTLVVTVVTFANTFTDDIRVKRYRKLRSLPISPSADLTGRFLAGYALAVASFCIVLVAGAATGAEYALRSPISPLVVLVALLLFSLVGICLAVVVATFLNDSGYVVAVSNVILLGLWFLTGYNGVSPSSAPALLRPVINVAPNSLAARIGMYHLADLGSRPEHLSPPPMPAEAWYVGLLAAWAIALLAVGSVVLDQLVYRGDGGE